MERKPNHDNEVAIPHINIRANHLCTLNSYTSMTTDIVNDTDDDNDELGNNSGERGGDILKMELVSDSVSTYDPFY